MFRTHSGNTFEIEKENERRKCVPTKFPEQFEMYKVQSLCNVMWFGQCFYALHRIQTTSDYP